MSKAKTAKLPWDARAADVLAGRTKPDAAELLTLINEVNPTGRGRDSAESAARYALKARIESMLIARFPGELEVVLEPGHPGIVSIRHRYGRRDACHAAIDALDDAARSWVQLQLDLGGPESDVPSVHPVPAATDEGDGEPPSSSGDALQAAALAEAEYDYERAQKLYLVAYRQGRSTEAAIPLVRFLVDTMAADGDALALEHEMPAATRAHPTIRVLLALAAARSGDEERALSLAARLTEPRAAEPLLLLARSALGRGDIAAAALRLREASEIDPAHPDLRAVAEEIRKREEDERAPHEAELSSLMAQQREAEAAEKAAMILARWPSSEPARRATREIEARRRADEGRRLIAEAEDARARGEAAAASALLQRALRAKLGDEDRARASRALAEIEAEQREREGEREVERALSALRDGDEARGLAAYAELAEGLRDRVRARDAREALVWLDAMLRAGVRARAAIDAATALGRASALTGAEPAAILALLAPHERALGHVEEARRLAERARAREQGERRRRALEDLGAAEQALAGGDAVESRRRLERAARDLDDAEQERVEALTARLAAHADLSRLRRRFESAHARHQYVDAERAARELAQHTEGEERVRWSAVAGGYEDDVRRALRVRVVEVDGGAELTWGVHVGSYPYFPNTTIDLRAGLVHLPSSRGTDVFVRSFSLDTGRMVRCVHLSAPEAMHEPRLDLRGDSVWLSGGSHGMMELSAATAKPLRWCDHRDPKAPSRRFAYGFRLTPADRSLWVAYDDDDAVVVDIEGERHPRRLDTFTSWQYLTGMVPPRVAAVGYETLALYDASGTRTARVDFPSQLAGAGPHPTAEALVVVFKKMPSDYRKEHPVCWAEMTLSGELLRTEMIVDPPPFWAATIAAARDDRMAFIVLHGHRGGGQPDTLLALAGDPEASGPPNLRVAYRAALGYRRVLMQDQEGRHAYLVGTHAGGIEIVKLGPEPPVLVDLGPSYEQVKRPLDGLLSCLAPKDDAITNMFVERFRQRSLDEIRRAAGEIRAALRAEPEIDRAGFVNLFWALTISQDPEGAADLGDWLFERLPGDPGVLDVSWAALVAGRRWAALRARLESIDPAPLPPEVQKHRHHLLAAATLVAGERDAAAAHLKEAAGLEGRCDLAPLTALVEALAEPLPPDDAPTDLPPLRQVLAVTSAADARLDRGDHDGTIALFERPIVWDVGDAQSLARLAEAHLARPARTPHDIVRKSLALAAFVGSVDDVRVGSRSEIPVPGATWPEERLSAIQAKAEAWLARGKDEA